ncbi:hypothetical protein BTE77_35720, partial [Ensifer adhaerens]
MARHPSKSSPKLSPKADQDLQPSDVVIGHNIVRVKGTPGSVAKYVRDGHDLLIHHANGKITRVPDFFGDDDSQRLELVFVDGGHEWPASAVRDTVPTDDETGDEVLFEFGEDDDAVAGGGAGGLLGLIGLGGAAIAAGASGLSGKDGQGGTKEAPAPAAPDVNVTANADGTVTASGKTVPGGRVTLTFPDGSTRIVTADAEGKYAAKSADPQPSGHVTAIVTDNSGKSSPPATADYKDTIAPNAPTDTVGDDDVGSVKGPFKDGAIDDNRPELSGKAEPGSVITIYDGSTVIGSTTADPGGRWSFTPHTTLQDGDHKISVVASDKEGNESAPSEFEFTVDTTAPGAPQRAGGMDAAGPVTGALADGGVTDDKRPE